ncbi:hypothetical protein EI94DRAFT_1797997 [Lactarius quietus]|nr:hypothetical protein EI94DRAFT_1797997 [Lactarius quietus]
MVVKLNLPHDVISVDLSTRPSDVQGGNKESIIPPYCQASKFHEAEAYLDCLSLSSLALSPSPSHPHPPAHPASHLPPSPALAFSPAPSSCPPPPSTLPPSERHLCYPQPSDYLPFLTLPLSPSHPRPLTLSPSSSLTLFALTLTLS